MSDLPPEVEASYIVIIDEILRASDLNVISAKRIRKGLQARVDDDISGQKEAIDRLIYARFDKISAEQASPQDATSTSEPIEPAPTAVPPKSKPQTNGSTKKTAKKRSASASSEVDDDSSEAARGESSELSSSPPPKKHKKSRSVEDTDAQIAARMQAEEYSRARSTRGGGAKRKPVVKKTKKPKKAKSKAKITDNSDSDAESGEEKKVNRTGGFHKPMNLSPALSALLNETQLSRPQTVKRIWAYIKENDLQDPNDKRQIRCDDSMRAVFKSDKIHMFTMNKVLNQNLYAIDE